jgi:hypothetical protein
MVNMDDGKRIEEIEIEYERMLRYQVALMCSLLGRGHEDLCLPIAMVCR